MQVNPTEHLSAQVSESLLHTASTITNPNASMTEEDARGGIEPTKFSNQFIDSMEMHADVQTVAKYFDEHHAWFRRCAHPMKVESISENGYALIIGRFGSFGYEVEPRIGLDLLPQEQNVYRIETIPIPGYTTTGYDVDFRAAMELSDSCADESMAQSLPDDALTTNVTLVKWHLDLTVTIQFPGSFMRYLNR